MKNSEWPTTRALRTFMEVAGSMSFSKAAKALSISQGAVSKQIASLETQLGQPLFVRQVNGIELTEAGQRYLPQVSEALQLIETSTANLLQTTDATEVLTVNVTPSFASLWLIERIKRFTELHSHLQVNIHIGDGEVKHNPLQNDLYLRCLPLSKQHEHATFICEERLMLVASAESLRRRPITEVSHIACHQLIPQITRPQLWEQFLQQLRLNSAPSFSRIGFQHFYLSLAAVQCHQGLALLPDFMCRNLLESGQIINPLALSLRSHFGYYLVAPNYKRGLNKVHLFEQWLMAQFS